MRRQLLFIVFIICCFWATDSNAQAKIKITGIITDNTSLGIPGATILSGVPLRSLTATNVRGEFAIMMEPGGEIVIRSIGFTEQRIKLKPGQTSISVRLKDNAKEMDEVVVRGYVARSKQLSTGASTTISGPELQTSPSANVESLLQGRVPGLNIQVNTGAPGMRGSTTIRGISSLSVSGSGSESFLQPTSPLYVIDGVPMDADQASQFGFQQQGPGVSPVSMIPQEDIASIEILKDAQATSLYGSRAAYGVIIITTKRGNSVIPRIRYTLNNFMQRPPQLRQTLGGNLERQLKISQIIKNTLSQEDIEKISQTPILSDSLNAYFNNSTNWQDVFYRTTFNQTHNLAVDGGDDKFNYKTNLNYYSEKGVIQNTGFDRYSLTMRMEYKPNAKFQFVGSVFGGVGKTNKGQGSGLLQTGVANNGMASSLLPGPSFFQSTGGIIAALETKNDNNARNLRTNVEASYMFIPGLRASTNLSYSFNSNTEDTFTPAAANSQFAKVYAFTGRDDRLYNRTAITYSKTLGTNHNFFINTFNEIYLEGRQNSIIEQQRTPNDQFQGPLGFDAFNSRGGGVLTDYRNFRSASYAAAFSYDYAKKYVVDLSYRLDGTSGSGIDNPYSKNPAVGLRWNFNQEEFLKDMKWLSFGALRLSWGMNINPNSSLVDIYGRYNIGGNYNGGQGIGLDFGLVPNPTLKPTTTTQYNFGFDAGVFNGLLEVVYDTYYKNVENLVLDRSLSSVSGFNTLKSNDASIVNYGHEIALTVRPLQKGPVTLSLSVNGAMNNDVLTKLPAEYNGQMIRFDGDAKYLQHTVYRVGANTLSNYLRINKGVYSTDKDVPVDPVTGLPYLSNGLFFKGGDPIFMDLNGDYILDGRDYRISGNSQPVFTGGVSANIGYKNFSMSVYASYTAKRTILNNALADRLSLMSNPFGIGTNGNKAVVPLDDLNMWQKPGDIAIYPNAYSYTRVNTIQSFRPDQSLWEEDGSYLKLNTITFAYMFDKRLVRRMGLNNIRIQVSAENLHTFTNYTGPNPENVTNMGRDASGGYPVPRKYNIGLNVEF
jgi:TonB-linked SusC/RagA family outer membrane protein